jgi:hypothetical protein
MAQFFQVTPPSVHLMILTLERRGLINRVPGKPRSISLRLLPEALPPFRGTGVSSTIPRPSPGQPDETLDVNVMLLRLGRIQLDDLFAHKGEHPVDNADFVPLLNVCSSDPWLAQVWKRRWSNACADTPAIYFTAIAKRLLLRPLLRKT